MSDPVSTQLNLARKWRPQTFNTIVGQQSAISMLKNSLFVQKYFPVYLFAGQRGCGKTTTARVFAASLNCDKLPLFQTNPKETTVPCLSCNSCTAMQAGSHPDFIEIDAASHTGVDNVRQIIEAASYVPLVGKKKVYLIDEAHMLSKAAFNAFLKVLEEPPATVHFLLATTELHKIPQTVLSRCFQLTFNAIDQQLLSDYLATLCDKEKITIEEDAVNLIIAETEGSARDALNLLEQVRFSSSTMITEEMVLQLLGKMSSSTIIEVFEHIVYAEPEKLLLTLQRVIKQHVLPQATWNMLVELARLILWLKHGVEEIPAFFSKHFDRLVALASACPLPRLHSIMQFLWEQEPLFMQTKQKQSLLEHTLVQLCYQKNIRELESILGSLGGSNTRGASAPAPRQRLAPPAQAAATQQPAAVTPAPAQPQPVAPPQEQPQAATPEPLTKLTTAAPSSTDPRWEQFIKKVKEIDDLLLHSILIQAEFCSFEEASGVITIGLSNNSAFFRDKLADSSELWKPLLLELFTEFKEFTFQEAQHKPQIKQVATPAPAPERKVSSSKIAAPPPPSRGRSAMPVKGRYKGSSQSVEQFVSVNVSDTGKWPLSNLLMEHFPGKIVKEKSYS